MLRTPLFTYSFRKMWSEFQSDIYDMSEDATEGQGKIQTRNPVMTVSNCLSTPHHNSYFALLSPCYFTALRAHRLSNKQTHKTASPSTILGPPTTPSSVTQSYKSQETPIDVTHPVFELNSSATSASIGGDYLNYQAVNERNSPMPFGSLQNATKRSENDTYATSGSLSSVTEEARTDAGSSVTHTKDPKSPLSSSNYLPFTASFFLAEASGMETTTTRLLNITVQNSTIPLSLIPFSPLKDGKIERKEAKINFQDPEPPTVPVTKDTTLNPESTTTVKLSTSHIFHHTNPARSTSQNPGGPIQIQTSSVKFETQSRPSKSWTTSPTESQISLIKDEMGSQSMPQPQNPHLKPLLHSQTSSHKSFLQHKTSHLQLQTVTSQTFPFHRASSSMSLSKSQTSSPNLILPSKSPTLRSSLTQVQPLSLQPMSNLLKRQLENSLPEPTTRQRQTSPPQTQLQTIVPLSSSPQPQPLNSFPQALPKTIPTQSGGQASISETNQYQSDTPPKSLSISPQPWFQPHSQTSAPQAQTFEWKQTQISATTQSINPLLFTSRFDPAFTLGEGKEVKPLQSQAKIETMSPIFASIPSATPPFSVSTQLPTLHSSSLSFTHNVPAASLIHPSFTTSLYRTESSTVVSIQTPVIHDSFSSPPSFSSMKNQPKTAPALSAPPSPSPISIPPHFPSVQPSSPSPIPSSLTSSTIPSLNSSHYPSAPFLSSVPPSTSSSSPFTSSQSITSSSFSSMSSSTMPPSLFSSIASTASSISSASSPPSSPHSSSSISTSTSTSSSISLGSSSSAKLSATSSSLVSSQSTSPHPEPSPAPRRSLYHPLTSTSSPVPSQQPTLGQRLLIRNHIAPFDPEPNLNLPTPRIIVHSNPEPHPNLDPNFKLNFDHKLKPNYPNIDTKPKHPSNPSGTPDKEGKYPDIIPRHSAWELGMLLGCSAGLGMVLVVGLRYMYRQTCGKRTEVTLNDREREYGRGERGLIHVQECGDLVRVRRIRDNSFVLLAEYDILASPGD